MIKRDKYLNQLIANIDNGMPKVITGVRRCGKSYLLKEIFSEYLKTNLGIKNDEILIYELDDASNFELRNPIKILNEIKKRTCDINKKYYVFIDEVQLMTTIINPELTDGKIIKAMKDDEDTISFVDVILGASRIKNVDLYVTGSNSKMLSSDIVTQFRDKAINIHVRPLSFKEFYDYTGGDSQTAFYEFLRHGGMPLCVLKEYNDKEIYLKNLFEMTYFKDILERKKIKKSELFEETCDVISFGSGQFLNSQRIANTIKSRRKESISKETVDEYIKAFEDAYIIDEVLRYDLKGLDVIGGTRKYYFVDTGLRNARLNFTSLDIGQLIENVVYNELVYNDYNVKVGTFTQIEKDEDGKSVYRSYEVDFYATKGTKNIYIQVTDNIDSDLTRKREIKPYKLIKDAIRKVIVVNRPIQEMNLENGYILDGIVDFLLNKL